MIQKYCLYIRITKDNIPLLNSIDNAIIDAHNRWPDKIVINNNSIIENRWYVIYTVGCVLRVMVWKTNPEDVNIDVNCINKIEIEDESLILEKMIVSLQYDIDTTMLAYLKREIEPIIINHIKAHEREKRSSSVNRPQESKVCRRECNGERGFGLYGKTPKVTVRIGFVEHKRIIGK